MACTNNFTHPNTLLMSLQLCASLSTHNTTVKDKVIKKLRSDLNVFCSPSYLSNFTPDSDSGYLSGTLKGAHELHKSILQTFKLDKYDKLDDTEDCAEEIARALAGCLPKAFSALYFLYFNTCSDCSDSSLKDAGQWRSYTLGGSGPNNDLYKWLTDQIDKDFPTRLIPRGFESVVFKNSNSGSALAAKIEKLLHHDSPASLQKALSGMLFLGDWHDSKLGHALCFLYKFCLKVQTQTPQTEAKALQTKFNEHFKDVKWDEFQKHCKDLKTKLKTSFINGTDTKISAVCYKNENLYSKLWKPEKFRAYLSWLSRNLGHLADSLLRMKSDTGKWTKPENFKDASTAGPFKYGFVPKSNWDKTVQTTLPSKITGLLQSPEFQCLLLTIYQPNNLKHCLQLCARLKNSKVSSNVIETLNKDLQEYCDRDTYLTKFENNLENVFEGSHTLLESMLQTSSSPPSSTPDSVKYGPYSDLDQKHPGHEHCVSRIVEALKTYLPQAYSALYFLYFNTVETDFNNMGGGTWNTDRLDDPSENLYLWLRDQTPDSGLMPRNFPKLLHTSNRGENLLGSLQKLISHSSGGLIQSALVPMLFICPWSVHLTGHALCFLHQFCSQVADQAQAETLRSVFTEAVPGVNFDNFKEHCNTLQSKLNDFIKGSVTMISPVCQSNNENLYSSVWGSDLTKKFEAYVSWLRQNVYNIISSLGTMSSESAQWDDQENFNNTSTAGPFKYGFVFSSSGTFSESQLQTPVTELTEALKTFLTSLFPEPYSLKLCLQLCAKLKDLTQLSSKVIQELKSPEDLKAYCAGDYLTKFANGSNGYLPKVFKGSHALLTKLLNDPSSDPAEFFGPYAYLPDTSVFSQSDPIVPWCCDVLCRILPQVYSALYFLYFNTLDNVFDSYNPKGGQRKDHELDQTGQNDLYKWLTDQPKTLTPGLIPRGFEPDKLSTNKGSALVSPLSLLVCHSSPASLQNALLGMLFLGPWHDSKLGHGILFLHHLCSRVVVPDKADTALKDKFNEHFKGLSWTEFQKHCQGLKASLQSFIGPNATSGLSAVCWNNTNLYSDVLDFPDKFPIYLDWLWATWVKGGWEAYSVSSDQEPSPSAPKTPHKNFLPWLKDLISAPFVRAWKRTKKTYGTVAVKVVGVFVRKAQGRNVFTLLVEALNRMREDAGEWDKPNNLKNASTAGPFKYGFVFNANWTSPQFQIRDPVPDLTKVLDELTEHLQGLAYTLDPWAYALWTGGSAAGTVGGVGGGAYYAYSQYGSTVTPGVSALLDEVTSYGFNVSDLAGAGLHCPLQ